MCSSHPQVLAPNCPSIITFSTLSIHPLVHRYRYTRWQGAAVRVIASHWHRIPINFPLCPHLRLESRHTPQGTCSGPARTYIFEFSFTFLSFNLELQYRDFLATILCMRILISWHRNSGKSHCIHTPDTATHKLYANVRPANQYSLFHYLLLPLCPQSYSSPNVKGIINMHVRHIVFMLFTEVKSYIWKTIVAFHCRGPASGIVFMPIC